MAGAAALLLAAVLVTFQLLGTWAPLVVGPALGVLVAAPPVHHVVVRLRRASAPWLGAAEQPSPDVIGSAPVVASGAASAARGVLPAESIVLRLGHGQALLVDAGSGAADLLAVVRQRTDTAAEEAAAGNAGEDAAPMDLLAVVEPGQATVVERALAALTAGSPGPWWGEIDLIAPEGPRPVALTVTSPQRAGPGEWLLAGSLVAADADADADATDSPAASATAGTPPEAYIPSPSRSPESGARPSSATTARFAALDRALRRAVHNHELRMHVQPVIDLRDGAIIGFEALARWQHGSRGLLPPTEWLDVAEANGSITEIDEWMLREACVVGMSVSEKLGDAPARVHVNISERQLDPVRLPAVIGRALKDTGLPGDRLILELDEERLWPARAAVGSLVPRLQELGVRVAVDDFGSGLGALGHDGQLPFEILKIDRSFVAALGHDIASRAVVQSTVSLARNQSLEVVAEGVETAQQATDLRALGCHSAQGYLWSAPQPMEHILAWAASRESLRALSGPEPFVPSPPESPVASTPLARRSPPRS